MSIGPDPKNTWWLGYIHFDTPGDYTLCFEADCLAGAPACTPPNCPAGNILYKECFNFKVHQWKDAAKLVLDEKWNLISLPLVPFDTNLTNMLASVDLLDYETYLASYGLVVQSNLLSIWNYDAHGQGLEGLWGWATSLTTIEDGKAYWFRLSYPMRPTAYKSAALLR